MRTANVVSVALRFMELICAAVVAGIVGTYVHYIDDANHDAGSRIVYVLAIAGISLFFSLIFMPPLSYSYYGFLVDFALFICWIVAFGLLEALGSCTSDWYWNHWGYYWGGWWRRPGVRLSPVVVGTSACGRWHAVQAFSFIGAFFWLFSGILSLYVCIQAFEKRQTAKRMATAEDMTRKDINHDQNGVKEETHAVGGFGQV